MEECGWRAGCHVGHTGVHDYVGQAEGGSAVGEKGAAT